MMIDLIRNEWEEKAHKIKQKKSEEMCFLLECVFILGCGKRRKEMK